MIKNYRLHKSTLMKLAGRLAALCTGEGVFSVTIKPWEDKRSIIQNAKFHAMLTDLHKQVIWHGQRLSVVKWKRMCTAAWLREEGEQPELIPALDGNGFDVIFEKTSELGVKKMARLIEWTYAFGADNGVVWSEGVPAEYKDYAGIK